ncbi:MAG: hypothetical protein M3Z28_13970 [Candidatus Dormibacteraeota bacterium]|nr:hypothetical protein [Candidatus Dormibacteraeota bacterium]
MRLLSRVAVALVVGALFLGVALSTGWLNRTVALEGDTFHLISTHSPLKFVSASPQGSTSGRLR